MLPGRHYNSHFIDKEAPNQIPFLAHIYTTGDRGAVWTQVQLWASQEAVPSLEQFCIP